MAEVGRVVALGASNLTRGLRCVIETSRAVWGPDVEVLAALGHGRSYGARSQILFRALPGILQSGLWCALDVAPSLPTQAVIADVGNDVLYGYSAKQILEWVEEALGRLKRVTPDITLTDLPIASIRRLSPSRYLLFRSVLFPSSQLSLAQVREAAEALSAGLQALATVHGIRFFRLDPAWYGFDPIHIRRSCWPSAWQAILGAPAARHQGRSSLHEALKLFAMAPERRWIFGVEQVTHQRGAALPSGGRVWLF